MESSFFESLAAWSEIVGGVAFVIVAVILFRKLGLPLIANAETARNAELQNTEHRREQLRAEVSKARGLVEEADREALAIAERAGADARREAEAIVAGARADGARLVANAEGELERARNAARDHLRIELIEQALLRARSLAGERVNADVDARLVAKTVDDLASGRGA
jgi:F0F1-type ATP synthase membrane subunit b/b'